MPANGTDAMSSAFGQRTDTSVRSQRAVSPPRRPPWPVLGVAVGAGLAVPLAVALSGLAPPVGLDVVAGVALLTAVALAVTRFDAAVLLGFCLLGVVLVEPAPVDLVFFVVVAIAMVTSRFRPRVPAVVLASLCALLALNLLSSVEVVDERRGTVFMAITAYLVVFGVWLSGYVGSRSQARLIVTGYVVAAAGSSVLGIAALFIAVPGSGLVLEQGRIQGFFQDPNVFGPFLVPPALILIEDLVRPRLFGAPRAIKALLVAALVLGVLFSFSRGAWVNLATGIVVLLVVVALRRGGGREALAAVLVVLLVAASAIAILSASGSGDFLLDRARLQSYDAARFAAQAAGIEAAERYPLGIGPGQFEQYASLSAHSTYVRVAGEQGLLGLFALLALLTATLIYALVNAVRGRDTYGVGSAALLGAWCGILVNSFVVDTLHWRHLWIVGALVWAGWARRTLTPARRWRLGATA